MPSKLAFDRVLFTTVVVLVFLGLAMVYSASAVIGHKSGGQAGTYLQRQGAAAMLGLVAMLFVMHVDYRVLRRRSVIYALVFGVVAMLVAALAGPGRNETHRWLLLGGLSIQPSELAKLVLVPFLAYQIARREDRERQRELLIPVILVAALMGGLVVLGRDLGSAVLLSLITGVMLLLAGLPWLMLWAGAAALGPAMALGILVEPYRVKRLMAFLQPELYPLDQGFQQMQSLIAIGSGGVLGLGLGKSLQKLHYLPYPHSDFVFAIVGEELGLIGALSVMALFGVLLWRGLRAGFRAPDVFGRYLAWGFTFALTVQALIHISVALALLPATGITLPFISYGGSSLVVTLVACGVLLNVSQHG